MKRHLLVRISCITVIVAMILGGPHPAALADGPSHVNFSFDQVDVRLLVKIVGEMTGRRFVVDDDVTGKVTVVTPDQVAIDKVYPLFLSILESSGYSIVERADAHYIIPLAESEIPGAPVVTPDMDHEPRGIITKIFKLRHINAADLKKVIEPMVRGGKAGALAAFGPTNHILVTDTAENISRLEEIINELDQPGSASVIEVVKLEHASAEELAQQLSQAIRGADSAASKFSAHVQKVTGGGGQLPTGVTVVPVPHANSLVLIGTQVQLADLKKVIFLVDVESPTGHGRMQAIFLDYLSAEEAAKSLNALLAKTIDKDTRQKIAIEPSIPNNALIVDASPRDFELVSELVEQLDKIPQQVMVEILIAEVTEGKTLDLGFEYAALSSTDQGETTVLGRTQLNETDPILETLNNMFAQGLTVGLAKGTFTDSAGNVFPELSVVARALAKNSNVKILSNVPLWAQNNQEASVSIVQNIPVLTSTIEGGSGTARDVIQNIERIDVGIKLNVTPQVNAGGDVLLRLNPSIEAIIDDGPEGSQFTPTIAKREVSTTVTIPNEATIVISGLIREDRFEDTSKVPLLGDIPILGMLFRRQVDRKQRTNLLIFVTPHIVTDMNEALAMRKELEEKTKIGPIINIDGPATIVEE